MFVRKILKVNIADKSSELDVLFDTGSSLTLMCKNVLMDKFKDVKIKLLKYPRKTYTLNGTSLIVDSYVDGEIEIGGQVLEERIYISKDFVKEVMLDGKIIKFPDLIVGVSTMEAWNIELDLKRGEVILKGAAVLF
ncbi:MAG: hypothetical protein B6U77_00925 [Candidatus Hecatellales archaeon ex4484_218]|nr:MAG: hypothetical protein B6U77_00925 [Candidatus Hecatellales archaeon ex4484_218]